MRHCGQSNSCASFSFFRKKLWGVVLWFGFHILISQQACSSETAFPSCDEKKPFVLLFSYYGKSAVRLLTTRELLLNDVLDRVWEISMWSIARQLCGSLASIDFAPFALGIFFQKNEGFLPSTRCGALNVYSILNEYSILDCMSISNLIQITAHIFCCTICMKLDQ